MRKFTLLKIMLLGIILFGSTSLSAQLLVENFNYTIGSTLISDGWTNSNTSVTTNPIDITTGLTFTDYPGSGVGGAANIDNTGEDDYISFTGQTSGVVYVSFLLNAASSNSAGYFFNLSTSPFNSSTYFARVFVNGTGNGVGISNTSTAPTSYVSITAGTTALIVIKYDFTSGYSYLYAFSSYPSSEPASPDQTSLTSVTTVGSAGSILLRQYNAAQRQVVDGIRVGTTWASILPAASSPTININPTSLSGFSYIAGSGPSSEQSFTVSGSSLTADVTVTAPTDYEISNTSGSGFGSTVTLTQSSGNVASTTIYARMKAGLSAGSYNSENIVASSASATSQNVTCSGTVSAASATASPTFSPAGGTYTSAQSVTLSSTTSGAIIYYTTNGLDPTSASTPYSTAISVSSTTTIKAIAYDSGNANPSSVSSATYTINIPTITVTETSIPAMAAEVGSSDSQTTYASGSSLTGDITIAITGTDAGQFSVNPTSITQTGGTAPNTLVTVTYTPTSVGSHTAVLTFSSNGATTVTRNLSGTATAPILTAPTATAATNVQSTSFKANWSEITGATSYSLNVYSGSSTSADYGFEGSTNLPTNWSGTGYVTTSSSNANSGTNYAGLNATAKYIETNQIDNITNLSFYYRYSSTTANNTVEVQSSADGTNWTTEATYTVSGTSSITYTQENFPITSGSKYVKWIMTARTGGSFYFDDVTITSGNVTPVTGSPFTVTAPASSYAVSGLVLGTTYYYDLTASNGSTISALSNTISVTTSTGGTGLDNVQIKDISVANGKIKFSAAAGEQLQIFNAVGQTLVNKLTVDGLNEISLNAKGVMIVKVGNKTAKVIL